MVVPEEKSKAAEICNKLKKILDDVLAVGDWSSSIFLKTAASKVKDLRNKTEELSLVINGGVKTANASQKVGEKTLLPGYSQVFILLYQIDGADLQSWYRTIKTLVEYGITRPAYKDENYAKEFVRSKIVNINRNGYAKVNIKDEDFYQANQQVDALGHPLFALKENAVKLENIIEFIHANKKRYAVQEDKLVFLGEI